MRFLATVRLSARTMRRAPVRSLLSASGLLLGILAITLTVASGEGARRAVMRQWRAMVGSLDALFVMVGGPAQRGMATMASSIATLTPEDAAAIAATVPNVRAVAPEQDQFAMDVVAGAKHGTSAVFGVAPNWLAIRGEPVARGTMFTAEQNEQVERVAVIGADVARDLFAAGDPVGQEITVGGIGFTVIGVLPVNGAGPGGISVDNIVLAPILTTSRRLFNRNFLSMIRVQLTDPGRSAATEQAVTTLLRRRHQLAAGQLDDFNVSNPQAMIAQRRVTDVALRRIVFWSGVLALAVGGVLLANLMYATTADRTAEIGMRRAAGATRDDILRQFWTEAVVVAVAAGVAGVAVSLLLIASGGAVLRFPLAVSWPAQGLAFAATTAVGVVAGYLPARHAARVPPAEALRRER